MSQKRARSPSPSTKIPVSIFRSSTIEDRSSKFIAFYSPALAATELQAHPELKSASHRIAAWRRPSRQRALDAKRLLETGHDDDGEKHGGKAVERVLIEMDVEGAVVVARWYGGVMLGPVRFDHMRNCARDAIVRWSQDRDRSVKKAKVREDEARKERLVRTLSERDESIAVLRDLFAEKNRQPLSASGGKSSPAKTPNYSTLPLATLEKLEQVRDATIGWILQQIEQVEKAQAEEPAAETAANQMASEPPKASETTKEPPHIDETTAKAEKPTVADLKSQKMSIIMPEPDGG